MSEHQQIQKLFKLACLARENSHSPYSGFAVGAALESKDGKIFTGCNVENAAYPMSICAEQVAISKAVSEGHQQFSRILVVASPHASPCGACRQVISEFFSDEAMIYSCDAEDISNKLSWTMTELLPERFTKDSLES